MTRHALISAIALLIGCSGPEPTPVPADAGMDAGSFDLGLDAAVDLGGSEDLGVSDEGVEPPEPGPIGSACADDSGCAEGTCRTGDGFPAGYCTIEGCDGGCPDGSYCSYSNEFGIFCAADCDQETPCRDGYNCRAQGVPPDLRHLCTPIRGASDGEPCETREDCEGGTCLPWTDGYCSTNRCDTDFDCASLDGEDNRCVDDGAGGICLRACADDAECRGGYLCELVPFLGSYCIEDERRPFDPSVFDPSVLDVECGVPSYNGRATVTYDIAPTTRSYMVVPMARDGSPVRPLRLELPDQTEFRFTGDREFMALNADVLSSMNPMLIPPGPDFGELLAPGQNALSVVTEAPEVCFYLLQTDQEGTTLDVNLYLVGVPGLDATVAGADPDLAAVLDEFSRIYEQVGVTLGAVRYIDVSDDLAQRFAVLANEGEIDELVAASQAPGTTLDEMRSLNVFMVSQITVPGAVVGLSPAQPGPAALHGTHGSGVVITAEYMGGPTVDTFGEPTDGNTYTGQILAHEVGHWLGLGHTTERLGQAHDHLADTPECGDPNDAESCPDWGNLMFPFARAGSDSLTADQGTVIRSNPVVRE